MSFPRHEKKFWITSFISPYFHGKVIKHPLFQNEATFLGFIANGLFEKPSKIEENHVLIFKISFDVWEQRSFWKGVLLAF